MIYTVKYKKGVLCRPPRESSGGRGHATGRRGQESAAKTGASWISTPEHTNMAKFSCYRGCAKVGKKMRRSLIENADLEKQLLQSDGTGFPPLDFRVQPCVGPRA